MQILEEKTHGAVKASKGDVSVMSISKATETKLKQTIATLREQLNAAHHLIGTQNKQIVQLRNDYFAASESCSNALADLRELQNNVASEIPTIRQLTNENANLKRMLADAIYAIGMEEKAIKIVEGLRKNHEGEK